MKLIITITVLLATALFANSIGQDEQYHNSTDRSINKSIDVTNSDEHSKSLTKEKGKEVTQGLETSKSKEKESSTSQEKSHSQSSSQSSRRTTEIQATMLMPEIDALLERFITHYTKDPRTFLEWLPIRENDLPEKFKAFAEEESKMASQNYMYYNDQGMAQAYENQVNMSARMGFGGNVGADSSIAYTHLMMRNLMGSFTNKYNKLFNEFFTLYGLPQAEVSARTYEVPQRYLAIEFYKSRFVTDVGGNWQGNFVYTIKNFFDTDLKFFSKDYLLQAQPQQSKFLLLKNSQPILEISPMRELSFYGDLIFIRDFGGEMSNRNFLVIDRKINADGTKLNHPNTHSKFDDYFKKLMSLYLEAFANIGMNKEKLSVEEIQFRTREYIYKKMTGRNDFLPRYLHEKEAFWKPTGDELAKFPTIKTSYNDVIFSKADGMILNQKVAFSTESSQSIQDGFSRLEREAQSQKFSENVRKAINEFQRENKQDMARLAMQLANKIANSQNSAAKQELVNKATTSTDLINTMSNLVK